MIIVLIPFRSRTLESLRPTENRVAIRDVDVGNIEPISRPSKLITLGHPIKKCLKYRKQKGTAKVIVPDSFDWRIQVKEHFLLAGLRCLQVGDDGKPILAPVVDQGNCGSCYAVASCQALSHRFAVATRGQMRPILSFQDMIYCGNQFIQETFENPQFNETLRELVDSGVIVEAAWYTLQVKICREVLP